MPTLVRCSPTRRPVPESSTGEKLRVGWIARAFAKYFRNVARLARKPTTALLGLINHDFEFAYYPRWFRDRDCRNRDQDFPSGAHSRASAAPTAIENHTPVPNRTPERRLPTKLDPRLAASLLALLSATPSRASSPLNRNVPNRASVLRTLFLTPLSRYAPVVFRRRTSSRNEGIGFNRQQRRAVAGKHPAGDHRRSRGPD